MSDAREKETHDERIARWLKIATDDGQLVTWRQIGDWCFGAARVLDGTDDEAAAKYTLAHMRAEEKAHALAKEEDDRRAKRGDL